MNTSTSTTSAPNHSANSSTPFVESSRQEVLKCGMPNAIAKIPPQVLAAALQNVKGVALDLSTVEGEKRAVELAESLLQNEATLEPLLTALERHSEAKFADSKLPLVYGPVAMAEDALPSNQALNVPPIGSPEFDSFMNEQVHAEAELQNVVEISKPAAPSLLGFPEETAEPVSLTTVKQFDAIFLDAQRQLMLRARSAHKPNVFSRVVSAVFSSSSSVERPLRFATKIFDNYTVVEARKGAYTKLHVESIASGKTIFVMVKIDGKVTMKDRITLSDHGRAVQRFTEVFADEAAVGAEALHELRDANSSWLHRSGFFSAS